MALTWQLLEKNCVLDTTDFNSRFKDTFLYKTKASLIEICSNETKQFKDKKIVEKELQLQYQRLGQATFPDPD